MCLRVHLDWQELCRGDKSEKMATIAPKNSWSIDLVVKKQKRPQLLDDISELTPTQASYVYVLLNAVPLVSMFRTCACIVGPAYLRA